MEFNLNRRAAVLLTTLVAVVIVAPAAGQQSAKLSASRCALLSGLGRTYCSQFVSAGDSYAKFKAASDWARYATDSYLCSGVTPLCLNDDMRAPRPFNSTCRVLQEDAACGDDPTVAPGYCREGVCYFNSGFPVPSRADVEAAQLERARLEAGTLLWPGGGGGAGGASGGNSNSGGASGSDYYGASTFYPNDGEEQDAMQPPQQQQRSARPGAYLQQQQQPIVEVVPDSAFGPALNWTVYVDADTLGRFVPQSFIGISREYTNESVYWDRNLDAWGAILDVLGPSPIVRIGGASQEALTAPPTPEYLRSLVALHCALGVRFIIGLPLFQNAPALALTIKQAFDKAFANFPKAVLSYELGNEPNYWPSGSAGAFIWGTGQTQCAKVNYPTPPEFVPNGAGAMLPPGTQGQGGSYFLYTKYRPTYQPFFADQVCYTPRTLDFYPGWARFATYFGIAANTVTGCNGPQTPEQALWSRPYWGPTARPQAVISGPAWGTLRVGANNVSQLIGLSRGCFWNEATVHYYTPVANRNATIAAMLSDVTIDEAVRDLSLIVNGVQDSSRVRVSEINSVAGGGRGGVSNVFAAALWTAQIAFEFAQAGASGVNFHWGNAGLFSAPGIEPAYIGVSNRFLDRDPNKPYPVVRAPWYGYLFFSRATGRNGGAIALKLPPLSQSGPFGPGCFDAVASYAFLLPANGEISVALINKSNSTNCTVSIAVNGRLPDGTVTRLLSGPAGLSATAGITWAGATYEGSVSGRLRGSPRSEVAKSQFFDPEVGNWTSTFIVQVPRASAALLLIPTASGGAADAAAPPAPSEEEAEAAQYERDVRSRAGLLVPQLPSVYGPLATQYRYVFGSNAEAERLGRGQFALQNDGSYRPVNTPLPTGPVVQGRPADGGAGARAAAAACPGIQKIKKMEETMETVQQLMSSVKRRRLLAAGVDVGIGVGGGGVGGGVGSRARRRD